jgi:hypothetical protein
MLYTCWRVMACPCGPEYVVTTVRCTLSLFTSGSPGNNIRVCNVGSEEKRREKSGSPPHCRPPRGAHPQQGRGTCCTMDVGLYNTFPPHRLHLSTRAPNRRHDAATHACSLDMGGNRRQVAGRRKGRATEEGVGMGVCVRACGWWI